MFHLILSSKTFLIRILWKFRKTSRDMKFVFRENLQNVHVRYYYKYRSSRFRLSYKTIPDVNNEATDQTRADFRCDEWKIL
jgi:hypothetical protein